MKTRASVRNFSKMKKSVVLLLSCMMLFAVFAAGLLPLTEANAAELTNVVISVPETLYMTPQSNYGTTTTSVKYYVNNTVNSSGTLSVDTVTDNTSTATAGKFYLYSPQISSIDSVSVNGASLSNFSATKSGNLFSDTSFTMTLSSGISSSNTTLLEWTIKVTDTSGVKHTLYAYTVAYAPYLSPVVAAAEQLNDRGSNHYCGALSYISGIHDITNNGNYYPKSSFLPLISVSKGGGKQNSKDFLETSSGVGLPTKGGYHYDYRPSGPSSGNVCMEVQEVTPWGKLTVDTSRYTNLKQVPNVTLGISITDTEDADSAYAYISNFTGTTPKNKDSNGDPTSGGHYEKGSYGDKATWYNNTGSIIWGGKDNQVTSSGNTAYLKTGVLWNCTVSNGTSKYYSKAGARAYQGGDNAICTMICRMNITGVNKNSLRTLISSCSKYSNTCYPGDEYETFIAALHSAATVLGDPTRSDVTDAYDTLNAAKNKLHALTALSLNTEVVVNPTDSACRYYTFTPSEAGKYIFFTYDTDNTPDPQLYIYLPNISNLTGHESNALFTKDDIGDDKIRELLSGSQSNFGSWQSYVVTSSDLAAGTTYILKAYNRHATGSYPLKVCKAVNIKFDATGGTTTFSKTLPGGHTLHMDQSGLTRSGHELIAWSDNGTGAEEKTYMASQTISIPTSDTTYYALWYPTNPTALTLNGDHTATISAPSEIQYYYYTPSETRTYLLYSTSTATALDPFVLIYDDATYHTQGTYLEVNDDGGNDHHDFVGDANRNFYIEKELTAGTKYLVGVKAYHNVTSSTNATTGTYPFRFEAVYKVQYDANGGSGAPVNQNKYFGKSLTLSSSTPTRTGYTFLGWSTSSTATTATYAAGGTYTGNTDAKLYAVWEPTNYTISYNLNQGTVSGNPTSYTIETSPVVLNNPTRTGYTFDGWTSSYINPPKTEVVVPNGVSTGLSQYTTSNPYIASDRDNHFGDTFTVQPGTTYRVYVTAKRTSGTLNMQGGIWYTERTSGTAYDGYEGEFIYLRDASNGWAVYYKDITVPDGKQAGQIYIQLNQSHGGEGHVWQLADCAVVKLSLGDLTYVANWTPNTYTVAYNGNGDTGGSTASSSHTYDTATALTANGFERKFTVTYNASANGGTCDTASDTATATFNGWATSAGGAKEYNNSQSVTNLSSTQGATVNLYAKWTDGSVTLPSASKASDDSYHYTFDGWYDAATGGNKIGNAGASYTPSENKTLYARFTSAAHNWDYANAAFNWDGFNCTTATVACGLQGGHNKTENTTVSFSETTPPEYAAAGERTYTAVFTENGTNYTSSKTDAIPALETLINLNDVALEDISGTSGKVALAPTKESDISFEIVGFVQSGGDHTLYKTADKPSVSSTLKMDGVRISIGSGGDKIEYKFTKMDFTTLPCFYALVKVTGTGNHKYSTNEIYTYQKVTLVPAKNVMIDDTVEAIAYANAKDTESGYGIWKRINDSGSVVEEALDAFNDPVTTKSSYEDSIRYSLGDAHQVSVANTFPAKEGPTATFTFTGSGFDVISVTDSNSGVFVVQVYEGAVVVTDESVPIQRKTVDTYYGYTYSQVYYNPLNGRVVDGDNPHKEALYAALENTPVEERVYNDFRNVFYTTNTDYAVLDGENNPKPAYGWVLSSGNNVLYQVPALSVDMETVGTYTVVIQPRFTASFGHYNESGDVKYFNFTLDGVRIYNPAGGNSNALAFYTANGETCTYYELVRDSIKSGDLILVDGKTQLQGNELASYVAGAPNDELYLMPGGTTAFDVDFTGLTDARLGLRTAKGTACSVTIGNGSADPIELTVGSATEQYYSLKSILAASGTTTVTVTNSGSGMLSITRLMTTTNTEPSSQSAAPRLSVSAQTAEVAVRTAAMLNADIAIDESTVETTAADDGSVTITLQTGTDAETIVVRDAVGNVIDPDSITYTLDETGVKNWTVVIMAESEGEITYTLQAEYENGYTPEEPTEITVTVRFADTQEPTESDPTQTDPTESDSILSFLRRLANIITSLIELIRSIVSIF